MAENAFAPVTPGEMPRTSSWPSIGCRRISWRRRSASYCFRLANLLCLGLFSKKLSPAGRRVHRREWWRTRDTVAKAATEERLGSRSVEEC